MAPRLTHAPLNWRHGGNDLDFLSQQLNGRIKKYRACKRVLDASGLMGPVLAHES